MRSDELLPINDSFVPPTLKEREELNAILGAHADSFVDFVSRYGAAKFDGYASAGDRAINFFYGGGKEHNILTVNKDMREYTGAAYLAFAGDLYGNQFCIHCPTGAVVFWDKETEQVNPIAKSLRQFLRMIQVEPYDDE